jgi:hypothetical protein
MTIEGCSPEARRMCRVRSEQPVKVDLATNTAKTVASTFIHSTGILNNRRFVRPLEDLNVKNRRLVSIPAFYDLQRRGNGCHVQVRW